MTKQNRTEKTRQEQCRKHIQEDTKGMENRKAGEKQGVAWTILKAITDEDRLSGKRKGVENNMVRADSRE